jgi:hypothetical protein
MKRVNCMATILAVSLFTACTSDRSTDGPRISRPHSDSVGHGNYVPHQSMARDAAIVAPVYKLDIDTVQAACVAACMSYFHRVDKDDRVGHTIFVNNNNLWAGDTDVNIALVETKQGIQVNAESHGAGFNQPMWNRSGRTLLLLSQPIPRKRWSNVCKN